jgi:nicotinate-nucleotide adenylyltransferase
MVSGGDSPRVGVLGSLCNPVHLGHLLLCQEATWQLGLSRVVIVPTGMPSHRPAPAEPAAMRLRLAQAAAIGNAALTVSRIEVERDGPSYMVDTLGELAGRYPGNDLVLLLGSDQYAMLPTWHEPERIAQLARIAVARRPGVSPDVLAAGDIERIEMPQVEISSSMIRERVAAGRPIRHLVPEPVRELIEAEGLYRQGAW